MTADKSIIPYPRYLDSQLDALAEITADKEAQELVFIHSILAQCILPLRAIEGRTYERKIGRASLRLTTGQTFEKNAGTYHDGLGLPYGTKARLIMLHICREALIQDSPEIHVADNMSAFMRALGIKVTGGKNGTIAGFKDQLQRLSTTRISMNFQNADYDRTDGTQLEQVNEHSLFASYSLWTPNGKARGLQGSTVRLSNGFYEDLQNHSVPLNLKAIRALSHSARALDVYTWLAYRLHRVKRENGDRITWKALQAQFGNPEGDLKSFKKRFKVALEQAIGVYPQAFGKVDIVADGRRSGLQIKNAPPPIAFKPSALKHKS